MEHRPKYLDLKKIRLPLPGFVSILHRISGFFLYLSLPLLLYALQRSLVSGRDFSEMQGFFDSFSAKAILIFLLWAFSHHLCAGIRVLLLDMEFGVSLPVARKSSRWVLFASLFLTISIGGWLW